MRTLWLTVFVGLLLLASTCATGCTAAELKSDESVAASDLHSAAATVAGLALAASQDPTLVAEANAAASKLLAKAGVPQATASKITAAISTSSATALSAAALELANATKPSSVRIP